MARSKTPSICTAQLTLASTRNSSKTTPKDRTFISPFYSKLTPIRTRRNPYFLEFKEQQNEQTPQFSLTSHMFKYNFLQIDISNDDGENVGNCLPKSKVKRGYFKARRSLKENNAKLDLMNNLKIQELLLNQKEMKITRFRKRTLN